MHNQKTLLPAAKRIVDANTMKIMQISVENYMSREVETKVYRRHMGKPPVQIITDVYAINHPDILGYLPSKVLWIEDQLQLIYYVSPALPDRAKPLGNAPCYLFTVKSDQSHTIEYDIDAPVFIDQVITSTGLQHVFVFAEKDMRKMLATDWTGKPWVIEVSAADKARGLDISLYV